MLRLITILGLAAAVLGNPLESNVDVHIIGGDATTIENHPYQLSLIIGGLFECGAILISPLWALTAAQCAGGSIVNMQLRAGNVKHEYNLKNYTVVQKVVHLNYDAATHDFDIALLRVNSSFPIDDLTIAPVALPDSFKLVDGADTVVSGWGITRPGGVYSDILLEATVKFVEECKEQLGDSVIPQHMMCAGDIENGGLGACQGDTGGPLVVKGTAPDPDLLVGIASWGQGCGLVNSPHVYTNVTFFRNWILANSGV